jgi:cobalt-zinc-cadmium efflux system outer membrane protein
MSRTFHILLLFTVVVSPYWQDAMADDAATKTPQEVSGSLSLAQARRTAFAQNWDLLAAKSNIDLATAQRIIAKEFPNPEVSLDVSAINVDGRPNTYEKQVAEPTEYTLPNGETVSTPGYSVRSNHLWDRTYDTVIAVSQLFEIGKRKHRISSAQAGIEMAEAQFRDAKRILDTAVIKAYSEVLLAEANVRILNDSAESMREEARLAEVRNKAGDISSTELRQIEVEAEQLNIEAKAASAAASAARISLSTLIGSNSPDDAWTPSDSLDVLAATPAPATRAEVSERPDLIAAQASLKKAEAELRGQKALRIPDPTVSLSYEHEPPDGPNSMGFSISLPLPAWNRYKGEICAAQVAQNDALREIHKIKAQIVSDRNQAVAAYSTARQRWQDYRNSVQPKSTQNKENISFAYKKGGATLLDLLSAQRTDNEVRLGAAQASADTLSALADLAAAFNVELNTESEESK